MTSEHDNSFVLFAKSLLRWWWYLLSSAVLTLVGFYALVAGKGAAWLIAANLIGGMILFFVAAFMAWKEEHAVRLKAEARTEKPKRTSAEQHHYAVAQKALQKLGPDTALALRHLKTHGKITFGTYSPVLPVGISVDRLVNIYIECLRDGLVTKYDDSQKGERTFEIAPTMNSVLDELLYGDKDATSV